MIKVLGKYGQYEIAYDPKSVNRAIDHIVITPCPGYGGEFAPKPLLDMLNPLEVENRVMRLLLYDLKQGYAKLEDL